MPIILIPSKNIYKIGNRSTPDNIISSVEQGANAVTVNYGNLFIRDYVFNFYEINSSANGVTELYKDAKNTEGFSFSVTTDPDGSLRANARLVLRVDKNTLSVSHLKIAKETLLKTDPQIVTVKTTENESFNLSNYNPETGVAEFDYSLLIRQPLASDTTKNMYLLSSTISLVGEYITLQEVTEKFGKGERALSLPANELIQATGGTINAQNAEIANKIIENYVNGKEVRKILCSIDDYFEYDKGATDYKGKKAINIKTAEMSFKLGAQVIPMVRDANGSDIPLSTYLGGNPKVFWVRGNKIFYDGAVWQELYLQEV